MRSARMIKAFCLAILPLLFASALPVAAAESVRMLVQASPLAGSQFHALNRIVHKIQAGDILTLTREPDNRFDANAVRVEWQGEMLGYVPRRENRAVAAAMDRGEILSGRVVRIEPDAPDPWQRLEFEIWIAL